MPERVVSDGIRRTFPLPGDDIKCQDWVVEFNLKPFTKEKSHDRDYTSWYRSGKGSDPGYRPASGNNPPKNFTRTFNICCITCSYLYISNGG